MSEGWKKSQYSCDQNQKENPRERKRIAETRVKCWHQSRLPNWVRFEIQKQLNFKLIISIVQVGLVYVKRKEVESGVIQNSVAVAFQT